MNPSREILFDLLLNALLQIALFVILAAVLSRVIAKVRSNYQYAFYVFVLLLSLTAPVVNTFWYRESAGVVKDSLPSPSLKGASANYDAWIWRGMPERQETLVPPPLFQSWVIWAWALLVLFRLSRFCRAIRRVRRLRGEAHVLSFDDVGMAGDVIEGMQRVSLLKSPAIEDPVAVGVFHPAIVLPSKLLPDLGVQELSVILAHEYGHIRRRDYAVLFLCELITIPVAWHPGIRYLKSKIAQTRELACDDYAAAQLGNRHSYASTLLRLASMSFKASRNAAVALGLFDGDNFETRVLMLTERKLSLSRAGVIGLVLATSISLSSGAVLAHAMSLQTSSPASRATESFAGTWHWMFDGTSFATMTLVPSGSNFTGSVTQSRIALKRDGSLLRADPMDESSPKQIKSAALEGSSLHVTVEDGFQFIVTKKDDTQVDILPVGAPQTMKPISAERVR